MSVERQRFSTAEIAASACARRILSCLSEGLRGGGKATLAVSGGSTPRLLFNALASSDFDWSRVDLFQVDERSVPPSDPQSNYKLLAEHFIEPARFPQRNVHRILAELGPEKAASMYEAELRDFFGIRAPELPHFDAVHLGMGADAHTASLFPGEPLLANCDRLAAAVYVEKLQQFRITLLPAALLPARTILFLIAGRDKSNAVFNSLYGPEDASRFPAQLIARKGRRVACYMDEEAGSELNWEGVNAAP